jgi:hypothetical protein
MRCAELAERLGMPMHRVTAYTRRWLDVLPDDRGSITGPGRPRSYSDVDAVVFAMCMDTMSVAGGGRSCAAATLRIEFARQIRELHAERAHGSVLAYVGALTITYLPRWDLLDDCADRAAA